MLEDSIDGERLMLLLYCYQCKLPTDEPLSIIEMTGSASTFIID